MASSDWTSNPALREWIREIRGLLKDYPGPGSPEGRRLCDEAVRAFLLQVVNDFLYQVGTLETHLVGTGREELRQRAHRAEQQIDSLLDKIQSAPYSFALFFSASRIPDRLQERIVSDDRAVIIAAQSIEALMERTLGPESDLAHVLDAVLEATDELDELLEARISTITEFQG